MEKLPPSSLDSRLKFSKTSLNSVSGEIGRPTHINIEVIQARKTRFC